MDGAEEVHGPDMTAADAGDMLRRLHEYVFRLESTNEDLKDQVGQLTEYSQSLAQQLAQTQDYNDDLRRRLDASGISSPAPPAAPRGPALRDDLRESISSRDGAAHVPRVAWADKLESAADNSRNDADHSVRRSMEVRMVQPLSDDGDADGGDGGNSAGGMVEESVDVSVEGYARQHLRQIERQRVADDVAQAGNGSQQSHAQQQQQQQQQQQHRQHDPRGASNNGNDTAGHYDSPAHRLDHSDSSAASAFALGTFERSITYRNHAQPVHGIAISDQEDLVASVSWDSYLRLHNVVPGLMDDGEPTEVWAMKHAKGLYQVAFSRTDANLVGVACADRMGYLWNTSTGECAAKLAAHSGEVNTLAFHWSDNLVVTGSDDKSVIIWDVTTGNRVVTIDNAHDDAVYGCAFQPEVGLLGTVGFDSTAKIWDPRQPHQAVSVLGGHSDDVIGVAFDYTGVLLATGSDDTTCRVWDMRKLDFPISVLEGHTAEVKRVSFNPSDSKYLITTSADLTAKIWDLQTQSEFTTLAGHTDQVFDAAWGPDGSYCVTASHDHTWRLWKSSAPQQGSAGRIDRSRPVR